MRIKPGVKMQGVSPELVLGLTVAESIYRERSYDLTVTSLLDGEHSKNSLHYSGNAADLRIWQVSNPAALAQELQDALGDDWDVVAERTHIHVEYQPKG